ncbi:MAG: SCO family protein [Burkholderiales bacterium]|jgi:protein SCO1/2|nr:SCO family protein [Burkholderiales bacterium]
MRPLARLAAIFLVAFAAACSPSAPSFKATDITGAEYAKAFQLTDHTGRARTLADFNGKAVVVFFGFTHCPDVCPTTLAGMRAVMDMLGEDAKRVQVLFVTVDPERDTKELLAQYVPSFHPSFVGLFGDADTTARVAKEFKVFYQKVPGTTPGSYTMDHSAGSYVYDPQGRLRLYVRHGASPDDIAADLKLLLAGQ